MPLFLRALNHSAVPNTLIFNSLATKGANIMDEKIAKLKEWIDGSDNIVFFYKCRQNKRLNNKCRYI